jgi:transposase-like protein
VTVPDPRRAKGRRHPLSFVLALAACAVLAGAKSLTAIAEWAADAPAAVLSALGGPNREPTGPSAPAEATVRRILQRADGDALDAAVGAWLAARDPGPPTSARDAAAQLRRSLAVDGKTVRGARRIDGTQVHLLAAMTGTGLVTAQREVGSKTNVAVPKPCPEEFREDVVRVARNLGPGVTVEQVAADFGVHAMALWLWMQRADIEDGTKPGTTSQESVELREVRRRTKLLEQENEVLRRAAAYLFQANLPGKGSTRS